MTTITLDLAGLKCPLPALRTRKALTRLHAGDSLAVRCTDPMAAIDIPHLVNMLGHLLVHEAHSDDGSLTFVIRVEPI